MGTSLIRTNRNYRLHLSASVISNLGDGVSSLAGYTPSSDGALIAFAVIGNGLPTDQDIRPWFDHVAAALAGCDCAG